MNGKPTIRYFLHFFDNIVSKAIRINTDPHEVKPDEIIIGVDFNREANNLSAEDIYKVGQHLVNILSDLNRPKSIIVKPEPGMIIQNRAQRRKN